MPSTEDVIGEMRREMRPLLERAMEGVLTKAHKVLQEVEQQRAHGLAVVAEERVTGLTEVNEERAKGLAEVEARWAELNREIATMHTHQEKQQGRVELNIGGYHFETSIGASSTHSSTPTLAAGTRRMYVATGAYSLIGTASTSATCLSTCATAWCR